MNIAPVLIITILVVALSRLFQWYQRRKKLWAVLQSIPGDPWYPLLGTTLPLIKAKREGFAEAFFLRNKRLGPFYKSWTGSIPLVHVMEAADVEVVLSSSTILTKADNYNFFIPWLGQGLITSSNMYWRRHRKLITPTFHFSILDNMMEIFYEKAQVLADILMEKDEGQFFDVTRLISNCNLEIICEAAMGVHISAMRNSELEYVQAIHNISDIILNRLFHPYLHPDFIFKRTAIGREHQKSLDILHGFARNVIAERKEKLSSSKVDQQELTEEEKLLGKKKRLAFLDLLLTANKNSDGGLTDEEIREEVDTFMFAGHDTTTSMECWVLYMLAIHPEVQEKVHQELDEVLGEKIRVLTPQDISELQYLDRVVKESQRVLTTIPIIARSLESEIELRGHKIPPGVMVAIHLSALHKDPKQFPDPERFDPDRFLPENISKRHPYAYVPFSAGPRNCIGQKFAARNSRVMLASVLQRFRVKAQKKLEDMRFNVEVTLKPQNGLYLAFESRNK